MAKTTNPTLSKASKYWWVIVTASLAGLLASFIQTVERIDYAKNPTVALSCDLNSVFSCSNVFDAWQSSVFGFSNSLMCIVFFAVMLGASLASATGSILRKQLRFVLHFFSLFFLGFGAWYLWQSTYKIGYVCIFCLICYGAVIALNWAWLRQNDEALFASKTAGGRWRRIRSSGFDSFIWLMWAMAIGAMIALHFW